MQMTFSELILFCTFVVTLVDLVYKITKKK